MRKFLLPVINLINIVLVSITFGLLAKSSIIENADCKWYGEGKGNFYQIAWGHPGSISGLGIVAFFLFIVAVAITVFAFFPIKVRKYVTAVGGVMYIAAGMLFLLCPTYANLPFITAKLSGAIIASAVLVFIAGLFTIVMSLIEFLSKEAE